MSVFLTELDCCLLDDDKTWRLEKSLYYSSDLLNRVIGVPKGFLTDFASVPRVPFIYEAYGDRCHRESLVHDWLYRADSLPKVSRRVADAIFFEAMKSRKKSRFVCWGMWLGVRVGGWSAYHKR